MPDKSAFGFGNPLESMSARELEILIEQISLDDTLDTEYLDKLLSEYAARPDSPKVDVGAAWSDFLEEYIDEAPTYPTDSEIPSLQASRPVVAGKRKRTYIRASLIAATIIIVLFGSMVVAQASGLDVFGAIARWTSDVFTFASSENEPSVVSDDSDADYDELTTEVYDEDSSAVEYSTLEEALLAYGIEIQLIPTWIPDGFEQSELEISESSDKTIIYNLYKKEDSHLSIKIKLSDILSTIYEKDDNIEVQYINNVAYYIYSNIETNNAVCYFEGIEYRIGGNITKDELIKMLESINEG